MPRPRRLSSLLVCALFVAVGCDEKGGGSASREKDVDQLARAPAIVLPPAAAGSESPAVSGAANPPGSDLRDAVAAMSASPANASKISKAVFDGNTRGGDVAGGDGVYAPGPGAKKPAAFTAEPRKTSAKPGDVPKPGSLPAVSLPKGAGSATTKGGGPVLLAYEAFQKELYDAAYTVYSRLSWGARAPKFQAPTQEVYRVTLHHTMGTRPTSEADAMAQARNIQHYHMEGRAAEGKDTWDDIGYHFLIDGEGRVIEGRHADALGAHAKGANTGNVGVAMMGDYNKIEATEKQKDSLKRLIVFLALKYRVDPRHPEFLQPHRHFNNTDCPGRTLVSFLPVLRAEVEKETAADLAKLGGFMPMIATVPAT